MKPLFDKKLQKNQIKLLEEQEEKIRSVLKVQKRREEQQAKHFKKFTEEAKEFIVSCYLFETYINDSEFF